MSKKLAIIGASYLQEPLINKAKEKGLETHVFAWECGDIGEIIADYFYPISIVEKETILKKCREIGIDGICTIASDLAAITVGFVAENMCLIGNPMSAVEVSTNKHLMRECFEKNGDPSPKSIKVTGIKDVENIKLDYPVIVKPVDRSGSRGVTKLDGPQGLDDAIKDAIEQGFDKSALIEEFAQGEEYSVEYISWKGKHSFLAMTQKYTTGAPHFIETAHMEPANISSKCIENVKSIVEHALDSLGIVYGASHSELKIDSNGNVKIIEIGGRMGGDNIGSSLIPLSTGFDFVGAVVDIAIGREPQIEIEKRGYAGIRFLFSNDDLKVLEDIKENSADILREEMINSFSDRIVTDSSSRYGYYVFSSEHEEDVKKYMPKPN